MSPRCLRGGGGSGASPCPSCIVSAPSMTATPGGCRADAVRDWQAGRVAGRGGLVLTPQRELTVAMSRQKLLPACGSNLHEVASGEY